MMPDLGRYAAEVLSAYGSSIFLLALVVTASVWKARKVRAKLEDVEARRGKTG